MNIRKAKPEDIDAIWQMFEEVIKTQRYFVFNPNTPKKDLSKFWTGKNFHTYVLESENEILGTYYIKDNQVDLGAHIANAGYMVNSNARGKRIGHLLCEHSITEAKKLAYRAIQFNMVVSKNKSAIALWKKFGFEIIGTIPGAFHYENNKYVDANIMFKSLLDE